MSSELGINKRNSASLGVGHEGSKLGIAHGHWITVLFAEVLPHYCQQGRRHGIFEPSSIFVMHHDVSIYMSIIHGGLEYVKCPLA